MRSVRCDVCGTKALMAASQCPKCGHAFEVRDGSGATLPLSHCATCDSYTHRASAHVAGAEPSPSVPRSDRSCGKASESSRSSHLRSVPGSFTMTRQLRVNRPGRSSPIRSRRISRRRSRSDGRSCSPNATRPPRTRLTPRASPSPPTPLATEGSPPQRPIRRRHY